MGKRIISQARGKGSLSYQARKQAFIYRVKYPMGVGQAKVIALLHSAAHSAPLIHASVGNEHFYNVAFDGVVEGQNFKIGEGLDKGNVITLKDIPAGLTVFNVEKNPGDG